MRHVFPCAQEGARSNWTTQDLLNAGTDASLVLDIGDEAGTARSFASDVRRGCLDEEDDASLDPEKRLYAPGWVNGS